MNARGETGPAQDGGADASHPETVDALRDEHARLLQFLYSAPIGLVETTRDGSIDLINPMASRLLMPLAGSDGLVNMFALLAEAAPDLKARVHAFDGVDGVIGDAIRIELPSDGASTPRILSVQVFKLETQRYIVTLVDATEDVRRERAGLAHQLDVASYRDGLTQLPNRFAVHLRLGRIFARVEQGVPLRPGIAFINCDRFKGINDAFGLEFGNRVLGTIALRLTAVVEQSGQDTETTMVARLGGDEFVVVVEHLRSLSDLETLATACVDALSQPFDVETRRLHLTASVGATHGDLSRHDADAFLQDASIAMVEAKRAGGARCLMFDALMRRRASERGDIESRLRTAIDAGELFVEYQPIVSLQPGDDGDEGPACSFGVEALVRWRHPDRGLVPPMEFIGIAEASGLIGALGRFVLDEACRQFIAWRHELGTRAPRLLAVNLSRAQLADAGFVDHVARVLRTLEMPPAMLQLEVTESLAAQDRGVQLRMHELKALGLTMALDDFGTGYSSLASLHQLPVDTVKIDRSFVKEAVGSAYHRVVIEATIRVAKALGMTTVAEGIESDEQHRLMRELGSEKGQGFLFSKSLSGRDLVAWIRRMPTDDGPGGPPDLPASAAVG